MFSSLNAKQLTDTAEQRLNDASPQLSEAYKNIITSLFTSFHVPHVETLTLLDVATASVNAFCPKTNFGLPPIPPTQMQQGRQMMLVTEDQYPLFFNHIMRSFTLQGVPGLDFAKAQGQMGIIPQMFEEYFTILQTAAKTMHENPNLFLDDAATIVGQIAAAQILIGGQGITCANPMLNIDEIDTNQGSIVVSSPVTHQLFVFPIAKGEMIYVPGAGYNGLTQFSPVVNATSYTAVFNDTNPFVTRTMESVKSFLGGSNIITSEGSFAEQSLPSDQGALVVASLIHEAGKDAIRGLLEESGKFLRTGGCVVFFNPQDRATPNSVDGNEIEQLAKDAGFSIAHRQDYPYQLQSGRKDRKESLGFDRSYQQFLQLYAAGNFNESSVGTIIIAEKVS